MLGECLAIHALTFHHVEVVARGVLLPEDDRRNRDVGVGDPAQTLGANVRGQLGAEQISSSARASSACVDSGAQTNARSPPDNRPWSDRPRAPGDRPRATPRRRPTRGCLVPYRSLCLSLIRLDSEAFGLEVLFALGVEIEIGVADRLGARLGRGRYHLGFRALRQFLVAVGLCFSFSAFVGPPAGRAGWPDGGSCSSGVDSFAVVGAVGTATAGGAGGFSNGGAVVAAGSTGPAGAAVPARSGERRPAPSATETAAATTTPNAITAGRRHQNSAPRSMASSEPRPAFGSVASWPVTDRSVVGTGNSAGPAAPVAATARRRPLG